MSTIEHSNSLIGITAILVSVVIIGFSILIMAVFPQSIMRDAIVFVGIGFGILIAFYTIIMRYYYMAR